MYERQSARVAHSTPGRLRLVIPAMRNKAGFFNHLEAQLLTGGGVLGVSSNAAAASIVVRYHEACDCLALCAAVLNIDPVERIAVRRPAKAYAALAAANSHIHRATGGRADLASLIAQALLFVVRRHPIARILELFVEPLLRALLASAPRPRASMSYRDDELLLAA